MKEKPVVDLEALSKSDQRLGPRPAGKLFGVAAQTIISHEKAGHIRRGTDRRYSVAEIAKYRMTIPHDRAAIGRRSGAMAVGQPERRTETEKVKPKAPQHRDVGDDNGGEFIEYDLNTSKARKEHWAAERAEIIAKREAGELVDAASVESAAESIGAVVQVRAKNLIPKLRPHMSDAGRDILENEIQAMLVDMADALEKMIKGEGVDDDEDDL